MTKKEKLEDINKYGPETEVNKKLDNMLKINLISRALSEACNGGPVEFELGKGGVINDDGPNLKKEPIDIDHELMTSAGISRIDVPETNNIILGLQRAKEFTE